jgi:outer membrane protein TolC
MQKLLRRFLPVFFCLASPVWAAGLADPFDTTGMAPLKPSPQLAARVGDAPCANALPANALSAIDTVDLALCNNPQTREIWATARVQAALVGVAQSAWLPDLDARASVARNFVESRNYNQNTAALTLSWLVFDFGQRSANIENARQVKAEGEARNALGVLANVMGFDAQQKIVLDEIPRSIPENAFQSDVDALIEEARNRRPDLKSAEAQLKAAEASVDVARAQGRPTVSLSTGPTWQDVSNVTTNGGSIGLTLNVPIFSGFETTYRVRSAEAQVDVRAAQRDRLRNQVALDVWKAYQNLNTASQSLKATSDLVASAEQSERVALGRYKAGVGTVLDLLTAQTALANARLQRIQAGLDWHVYRATLAQTVGALDYTLLQPAVQGKP